MPRRIRSVLVPAALLATACSTDADGENGVPTRPPVCGNQALNGIESCDGTTFINDWTSCTDAGLGTGALTCGVGCKIGLGGCSQGLCATQGWYNNDRCDACQLFGETADAECAVTCAADGLCGDFFDPLAGAWTCAAAGLARDPDCPLCGDGVAGVGEPCDGTDLRAATCQDFNFASGVLACAADCALDFSGCVAAYCGDGIIDRPGEVCDSTNLGGLTCTSLGYSGGALRCDRTCLPDTSRCTGVRHGSVCGDDQVTGFEECEGTDTASCTSLAQGTGMATCGGACQWNTSTCSVDWCEATARLGDGMFCDLCLLLGGASPDPDCGHCGEDSVCADWYDQRLGTWTCRSQGGTADPDCGVCGNNDQELSEQCDGTDLGPASPTCQMFGFASGTLACSGCVFDFLGCVP